MQATYHKVTILQIIRPEHWKVSLHVQINCSQSFSPPSYNYYFYQMAWINLLMGNWSNRNEMLRGGSERSIFLGKNEVCSADEFQDDCADPFHDRGSRDQG